MLGVWRPWARDLSGHVIDSGHHMGEEALEELTRALLGFFGAAPAASS